MDFDLNSLIYQAVLPSAENALSKALQGDITTIALLGIALVVCFVILILLVELAAWLVSILKRFILLAIIAVSTLVFLFSFCNKILSPNFGIAALAAGILGIIFAALSLFIAAISMKKELAKSREERIVGLKSEMKRLVVEKFENELKAPPATSDEPLGAEARPGPAQMPGSGPRGLRSAILALNDKGIAAIVCYSIVVEFAVLGGITATSPSETAGLVFFAIAIVVAMAFIKSAYASSLAGMRQLLATLAIAAIASAAISSVWLGVPFEALFSFGYFKTSALLGLIAALATSMFAGSRG